MKTPLLVKNTFTISTFMLMLALFFHACGGDEEYRNARSGDDEADKEEATDAMAESDGMKDLEEMAMLSPEMADTTMVNGVAKDKKDPSTWKRSKKIANEVKLAIGDYEELELRGMQITAKVDGFRARVVLDCFFYNDREWQTEGTFKLRLPNGASPYYFAFGEAVMMDKDTANLETQFNDFDQNQETTLAPHELGRVRDQKWANPKEARIVPKEKAAFAYGQTVRRSIDPALMEWAGADVFNCRVFPLAENSMSRIVVGYDVDLTKGDNFRMFELPVPEISGPVAVDLDIAKMNSATPQIKPSSKQHEANNRIKMRYDNHEIAGQEIKITYKNAPNVLLNDEQYFAGSFNANLPNQQTGNLSDEAIIMLDVSLSSNPDKFNVWLKMAAAILRNNKDAIKKFNVLCFNVEQFWWKNGTVANTEDQITAFLDFANQLSLEGATDLGAALNEASNKTGKANLFLLSDAATTWGEDELYAIAGNIDKKDHLYAYNTGFSGTDKRMMSVLTRTTGGAIFTVVNEDQVAKASKAFRSQPWKIESVTMDGTSDLILKGRPQYIYPGQQLVLAGRGNPATTANINLTNGQSSKNLTVQFKENLSSELAKRTYGQIATQQIEEFGYLTETLAQPYATYFRVPGKTCSMLMLETEEDYLQYNIKPEEDLFVINRNTVNAIVKNTLDQLGDMMGSSKATFMNFLKKLENIPGVDFKIPNALQYVLNDMTEADFKVLAKALACEVRNKDKLTAHILEQLTATKLDYDFTVEEAERRKQLHGVDDALKLLSSLIEKNPGDNVMIRDIGYSAMQMGIFDHAYHLFRRVANARPFEPQTYHAMAQVLSKMNKHDLALVYYEIALAGQWDSRFGDFRTIVLLDYTRFLQHAKEGKINVKANDYVASRIGSLKQEMDFPTTDLMITIAWNTDNTDIDLHVIEPTKEECFYSHPDTKIGGHLTRDVTQGYGPEMYTLKKAIPGKYKIKAKYYSSDRNRASTRTKVYATIYENWGKKNEKVTRKIIALNDDAEMHDLLTVSK
jgi:tetratricopeptide (TPR) repeat protein